MSYVSIKYKKVNKQKTNGWTIETTTSKRTKGSWAKKDIVKEIEAKRARIKCPAVKLAARRTPRVIGRISCLTNSIATIKTNSQFGVPFGVKWSILFFKKKSTWYIMDDNHIIILKRIVSIIWARGEKIYENNEERLIVAEITKKTLSKDNNPIE